MREENWNIWRQKEKAMHNCIAIKKMFVSLATAGLCTKARTFFL
jgi:hypothetical protein